jgi:TonB-linked SusC/RagA family outer membrane protein
MKKNLFFRIFLSIMLVVMGYSHGFGQGIQVTGKVVAAGSAETIPGVNVIIEGTTTGVVTDFDGKYTISVPNQQSKLLFTYIGFLPQTINVGNSRVINVSLRETTESIEEVVVVGYGIQRKESVIGAISVVDNKELNKMPVGNLSHALTGKVAGVITSQAHGEPGFDDAKIFIRGRATFDDGNSQPLILVDGVERSFFRIDPSEIEQISVLKDASATAVYGVRGANGVILVTTKRGREGKPKVSFAVNSGFQTPTRLPKYLDSYNSLLLFEEALANDGRQSNYSADDLAMYKKASEGTLTGSDFYRYPNVDWYSEMLKNSAPETQASINISGGTARMKYFMSAAYFDQQGLYNNTESFWGYGGDSNVRFRRYSFRVNLDFDVTKNLKLSMNMGTRFERRNTPNWSQFDIFAYMNRVPGWMFPVKWEDGSYGGNGFAPINLMGVFERGGFNVNNTTVNENSFIAQYKLDFITKGLSVKGMYSFDNLFDFNRGWNAEFATFEYNHANDRFIQYRENKELGYGNTQQTNRAYYAEMAVNYARTFFDKHETTGLLLYNQRDYARNADIPSMYQGLVGRVTYNYDTRYFTELNFGYNGSENFAKGNRFGFFPSVSAGWVLSNEPFFKEKNSPFSFLKLRASYGEVGNDKTFIGTNQVRFLYLSSYERNTARFGTTNLTGIYETAMANPIVSWERAKKANVAVESKLINNLLSADIDLFYEKRDNILYAPQSIPSILGSPVNRYNIGEVTNKGFEIVLRHENKIGADFGYNISATYALAQNSIVNMDEPVGMPANEKREGQSINQYIGWKVDKFFESEEEIASSPRQNFSSIVKPGDFKYADINKDGVIDELDVTHIGYSDIPEQTFTFGVGANWKGLELTLLFQGATRVSQHFFEYALYEFYNGGGKVQEFHQDRWDPAQSVEHNMANAKYPLLHYDKGQNNQRLNDYFLKDGTYLRLKNAEISYTLPTEWVNRVKLSNARVFVNGTNLFTLDKIKIRDPEASGKADFYPVMRFINMGINIEF